MTAHTAAPWQITEDRKGLIGIATASSEHICEIFTHGSRPGGANRNIAEHRANAQLIVGAPDLLRAAKMALYEMRHTVAPWNSFTDAVDLLDAAIAKAEGVA